MALAIGLVFFRRRSARPPRWSGSSLSRFRSISRAFSTSSTFRRAPAKSLFTLTAALTICGVALFPGISPRALGGVALALAVVSSWARGPQSARMAAPNRRGRSKRQADRGGLGAAGLCVADRRWRRLLLSCAAEGVTWVAAAWL